MIDMTSVPAKRRDGDARLGAERELLRAAALRLTTGRAERSNGGLTVSALAVEAGLSRQRLYEHHPELVAQFQTAAAGQPPPPEIATLEQKLAAAHARIGECEAREAELVGQIKTLCALIAELTHETHTHNVIDLPLRARDHGRRP